MRPHGTTFPPLKRRRLFALEIESYPAAVKVRIVARHLDAKFRLSVVALWNRFLAADNLGKSQFVEAETDTALAGGRERENTAAIVRHAGRRLEIRSEKLLWLGRHRA